MPELTPTDVAAFTKGRLSESDPETQRLLDAALVAARRYCGWHVSPVNEADAVTVDGPGGRKLFLRTQNIVSVDGITEDGQTVDSGAYVPSADIAGMIYRRNGCWTCEYAAITVTLDHGYPESEAADWRHAILLMVDQMSLQPVSAGSERSAADLTRKRVDDVEYQWSDGQLQELAAQQIHSVSGILARYRILPV